MSTQKRKKHGYADLLKYMHMLENGISFRHISEEYGIDHAQLAVLWVKYQEIGPAALNKKKNIKADFELRSEIVLDIEENHLTLQAASLKYGASPSRIKVWRKMYRQGGLQALKLTKKRGRPTGMGRPKKKQEPLTELERLRKENEELKTQIALLKKVKALAEEREARLRGDWQEPSKS